MSDEKGKWVKALDGWEFILEKMKEKNTPFNPNEKDAPKKEKK